MNPLVTIRPLATSDQEFLWEALYEALWDPPDGPRRPREVLERPYIRIYAENWGSQADDLGFEAVDEQGKPIARSGAGFICHPTRAARSLKLRRRRLA